MTEDSSRFPDGESADEAPAETDIPIEIDPQLDPQLEQFVLDALASLGHPTMPEHVAERISHALAVEPPYGTVPASNSSAIPAPPVTDLAAHRRKRSRWIVGLPAAGIAAAAVVVGGTVVLSEAPAGIDNPATTAAVVPMSTSGVHYKQPQLASQVSAQLPAWRSLAASATASAEASASASGVNTQYASDLPLPAPADPSGSASDTATASSSDLTASPSAPPSAQARSAASTMRDTITACLKAVTDRKPLHIDVGMYTEADGAAEQQVAVVSVATSDTEADVYVISIDCSGAPAPVRAHVHIEQ